MKKNWWKIVAVLFLVYTFIAGFLFDVPKLPILHETIRNLYFHVTMWFSMIIILTVSLVYSIKYLSGFDLQHDRVAKEAGVVGLFMGCLGLSTGMVWARFTWGAWWVNDPKLNGAAITILIYLAYHILRNSFTDEQKRAKVAAVYNILAYVMLIVFLMILPRMTDSLHPGNGGNPGFGKYDLDRTMRMVFYPAIIGWSLLGVWILSLRVRLNKMKKIQKQSVAFLVLMLSVVATYAADNVAMADELRESGKIYIVVIVVLIIFAGIVGFLINLDRKIGKLEKEVKKEL